MRLTYSNAARVAGPDVEAYLAEKLRQGYEITLRPPAPTANAGAGHLVPPPLLPEDTAPPAAQATPVLNALHLPLPRMFDD